MNVYKKRSQKGCGNPQINFCFAKKKNMEWKINSAKLNSAFIEGLSHSDENSLTTEKF